MNIENKTYEIENYVKLIHREGTFGESIYRQYIRDTMEGLVEHN